MASLKEFAYENIKNKIINCELKPGSAIEEKDFIEVLNISRTPIREALSQLANENLVDIIPRRGIFVTQITLDSLRSLFQFREVLEPFMVKIATHNIPEEKIESFHRFFQEQRNGIDKADYQSYAMKDDEFHLLISDYCNNIYAVTTFQMLFNQNHRIRVLSNSNGNRMHESIEEHLRILECIKRRDERAAEAAMRDHMVNAKEHAFKLMKQ
jgi:DNA-binding GntR family transcriptional regulator